MLSINDKVVFCYGRYSIVVGSISNIDDSNITVIAKDKNSGKSIEYRVHPSQVKKVNN